MNTLNQGLQTATGYFHSASLDIVIIVGLVIFCTFLTFQFGKRTVLAFILALYPSLALFTAFPFKWTSGALSAVPEKYVGVLLFCILWFGVFFLLRRFIVSSYSTRHFVQFFEAFCIGSIASGLILAIAYRTAIFPSLYAFSNETAKLFSGDFTFFLWLLAPFIGMVVFMRS